MTHAGLQYVRINGAPAGGLAGFVLQLLAKTLGEWARPRLSHRKGSHALTTNA